MDAKSKDYFVVDSSFVLSFLLPDERQEKVDDIFNKLRAGEIVLVSGELLPYEVLNGLKMGVLRKRISLIQAAKLARLFLDLLIILEKIDWLSCWNLAWQKKLTIYDASYLFLSHSKRFKLLSFDKDLTAYSENK